MKYKGYEIEGVMNSFGDWWYYIREHECKEIDKIESNPEFETERKALNAAKRLIDKIEGDK